MAQTNNTVVLMGRLGGDPTSRTVGESSVVSFNIAVKRPVAKRANVTDTDWITIELWDKSGQTALEHLKKGDQILVRGAIRIDSFTAKDGTKVNKTYIRGDGFDFTGSREQSTEQRQDSSESPRTKSRLVELTDEDEDEFPF